MEQAVLVDISNTPTLQDITLTSEKFLIGRGLHNSRVIEDINISRTHCILEQSNGDWRISDNSSNGTWLNGQLLEKTKTYKLTNGDVIVLSETVKFVYRKPSNQGINVVQKTFSENEILDIAETVIAEVEALDSEFYLDKFDETVIDGANENAKINPSRSLSDENKHNSDSANVKTELSAIGAYGPINIHHAGVVNIVQRSMEPDNGEHPVVSPFIQRKLGSNGARPESSTVIVAASTASYQQPSCSKDNSDIQAQKNLDDAEDELQCSICTEMFVKAVTLSCSHTFCKYCITQWLKNQTVCPICRSKVTMQFPTLVVDNFIDKILEGASEEVKQHRRDLLAEREAASAPPAPATSSDTPSSTSHPNRRRPAQEPIEIVSSEDDSDQEDDTDDMDDDMDDDWDWNHDFDNDNWDEDYNGVPGCYYGGYGHCYSCGQRGHWANGCPNRRTR